MVKRRKSTVLPLDECPLSQCMNLIGGAWTPNIIWYLRNGPRRFSELKEDLRYVSPKVLSDKLKKMESDGIVIRTIQATTPPTVEYSLTDLGTELHPILDAIVNVGKRLKKRQPKRLSRSQTSS